LRQGDRAIADFTSAARANPSSGKGLLERADAYQMFYPNRPATALKDVEEAIRREPKNPLYYNRRGSLHFETNNFAAAISDFNRAISLKPDLAAAYGNRGLAHYWQNRKDEAAADFRRCLVLDARLRPWLEQQVQLIPQVRQWQADFRRWYAEVLASAAKSRDDTCSTTFSGNADRVSNCRRHGVTDTDDKVRKNQL
jgi:tetratricopeptide (TPR) repeat protein